MIYCVVTPELDGELFERLSAYYADDPNVEVIRDRRRRAAGREAAGPPRPTGPGPRVRRRARVAGEFPRMRA